MFNGNQQLIQCKEMNAMCIRERYILRNSPKSKISNPIFRAITEKFMEEPFDSRPDSRAAHINAFLKCLCMNFKIDATLLLSNLCIIGRYESDTEAAVYYPLLAYVKVFCDEIPAYIMRYLIYVIMLSV